MATVNPQTLKIAPGGTQALKIISVVFKLFAAFPLLVGVGLLAGAAYSTYSRLDVLKHWPTVDAQVTQSRLTHHQETFKGKNGSRTSTVYEAQIEFQYTVAGKQYQTPTGSNYSSSNYASMKQKVDVYAPGTHHLIRYSPANPNDIRYDVRLSFDYFMLPVVTGGIGLVAFLIGLGIFRVGSGIGRVKVRCPSCGGMVSATEENCPLCGAPLAPTPDQTSPEPIL